MPRRRIRNGDSFYTLVHKKSNDMLIDGIFGPSIRIFYSKKSAEKLIKELNFQDVVDIVKVKVKTTRE
jgi:hypothetical protein